MDNFGENVFFSLDETDDINIENTDFDFTKIDDYLSNEEITEIMGFEYKTNYNVKELLLICEYYGIAKELKVQKFCKEMIIYFLIDFENDPLNNTIVLKRKKMWSYINMLKNDKFMKKYIIW